MNRSLVRVGVVTLVCVVQIGCAAITRPPLSRVALESDARSTTAAHRAIVDSVIDRLARRAVMRGDSTLDLLFLSGGGQHGAYGAGFLRGWRARPDPTMPRFDLITGVSTGALQSPFVLIGSQAALDTLAALYDRAADGIAPTFDWWHELRRTGGIVNVARYTKTIASVVNDSLSSALRREFREERQLIIATTDLDLGIGWLWNLERELDTTARGLDRTRQLLRATSAIPGIFPPVIVDGHVHVDGSVISNVATILELDDYRALAAAFRRRGVTSPVTIRVWAIFNLFTHVAPASVNPANHSTIDQRSTNVGFLAQQPQIVEHLATLARAVTTDVPGLRMELRVTAVPADLISTLGGSSLFNSEWMRRLLQVGYARAQSTAPWDTIVGPYERPLPRNPSESP